MILVTVGTNEQPFDRLVRGAVHLSTLVDEELLVQYGSSQVLHGRGEWIDFLPFDALASYMKEARVVICHAGVGSIMLARRYDHRPIVVARRHHLQEAVDDHQLELASRLHESDLVTLVENENELVHAVAQVAAGTTYNRSPTLPGASALSRELDSLLKSLGARPMESERDKTPAF